MKPFFKKTAAVALISISIPGYVFASSGFQSGLDLARTLIGGQGIAADQTLTQLILDVIQLLLSFAGPLAVLFVIIGGFRYITSAGNEELAKKGKQTLVNSAIGIIIVILSYTIVTAIQNTLISH